MNTLLERQLGLLRADVFARREALDQIHSIQAADILLTREESLSRDPWRQRVVHEAGTNALAIESTQGRLLISGGADPSIYVWRLDENSPIHGQKAESTHTHGITALSWYPFDNQAFISSSYDYTLKLFSTDTLSVSASFNLPARISHHSISPIASHLLVACATSYPAARLIDLRSGDAAHSLAGHNGAVLTTAWSPIHEHILLTGGVDGTVRFWDIRRSHSGGFAQLDMDVTQGMNDFLTRGRPTINKAKAHAAAVNGISWTDNGALVVTSGHDDKIHVWDAVTRVNTLANFGPAVHTSRLATMQPLIVPSSLTGPQHQMMFYPSQREILIYDLLEGVLLKKLKPAMKAGDRHQHLNMSLAWRKDMIEMYSAHADGSVRVWQPVQDEDREELDAPDEDDSRKRKREALDELYRNLSGKKITFT